MPKSILIINGHPDPVEERLCHAITDSYDDGARQSGHMVERLNIGRLKFPLIRSAEDWRNVAPPVDIADAQQRFKRADHIVLVYPLWMGTMPALTKGFIEQLFRPGFSHDETGKGFPKPLLKGKSARIIVTMGMPAAVYRYWFFMHSLKSLERNVLGFSGVGPIRHTLIGMVESMSERRRADCITKIYKLGKDAS
jgi:putative NADPH-quinone reductase